MLIFSYQSYTDQSYIGMIVYILLCGLFIELAKHKYKTAAANTYADANIFIALNAGLLPLLYSNLFLSQIIWQGENINESGMVFVLVLIYSPIMFGVTITALTFYSYLNNNRNA